ncbi:hypothetical protein E1B28_010208 [Marasmius oreades]|uniref:Uncharacterized protein n=1 Tax=Marasmius oreades TaxID=181124 RepID=A0A9P7RWU6_9AGAR|nr:uncharacterized protein E1B28_010208 [Marasmius oreades]KAG7091155.1 hypothetical protein E1B28_010208 [Marasmius oreades]
MPLSQTHNFFSGQDFDSEKGMEELEDSEERDDTGKIHRFDFDGTLVTQFDDYFITPIGGDNQTATQLLGIAQFIFARFNNFITENPPSRV